MKVPTYDSFQVAPEQLPGVRYNAAPTSDNSGQTAALGHAMQTAGGQLQQILIEEKSRADMARVDDALNQTEVLIGKAQDSYRMKRGADAFPADKPLDELYAEDIRTQTARIAQNLGNERQRQIYQSKVDSAIATFRVGAQRHSLQEVERYKISVQEAKQALAVDAAKRGFYDSNLVDAGKETAKAAVKERSKLEGFGEDSPITKARMLDATSGIHAAVIDSALQIGDEKSVTYALQYFNARSHEMTAGAVAKARADITERHEIVVSDAVVRAPLSQAASVVAAPEMDVLARITAGSESNNSQFTPAGVTVTSPKGALGVMQVMPSTGPEAAKLAGLPWDAERLATDAEYNRALGIAYMQKQYRDFGGDPAKMWAAYNAGPGALRAAIQTAANPKADSANWLDHMPPETRAYVAKNMALLGSGAVVAQKPTVESIMQAALADPRVGPNPSLGLVKRIHDNAARGVKAAEDFEKQRGTDAVKSMQQWILANPGAAVEQAPHDVYAAVFRYAPGQMDSLKKFAETPDPKTDVVVRSEVRARILAGENVDMTKYITKLSASDYKQLDDLKASPEKVQDAVTLSEQLSVAHMRMEWGPKDAKEKGLFDYAVEDEAQRQAKAKGRKLDQGERDAIIESQLKEVAFKRANAWFRTTGRRYEFRGTPDEAATMSAAERAKIVAALTAKNRPVNDAEITRVYRLKHPIKEVQ